MRSENFLFFFPPWGDNRKQRRIKERQCKEGGLLAEDQSECNELFGINGTSHQQQPTLNAGIGGKDPPV